MKKTVLAVFLVGVSVSGAYATEEAAKEKPAQARAADEKMVAARGTTCAHMQENVTINVNFNLKAKSFTDAKTKFEEKMQQVNEFAKQQAIKKFVLQSMNYNISGQPMNYDGGEPGDFTYQLGGNSSYLLDSSDSAFKLAEFLTKQKFQASVNVNQYQNGGCNNMMNAVD